MIEQILTQIENKAILVKLKDDGTFSGIEQIELKDFSIEYFLEVTTHYRGNERESFDIEISDIIVFDSNGDYIDTSKKDEASISRVIEKNLEFN